MNAGSIPAPAGEPSGIVGSTCPFKPISVYPRACGGTASRMLSRVDERSRGLSPRLRGNPQGRMYYPKVLLVIGLSPRLRGSRRRNHPLLVAGRI